MSTGERMHKQNVIYTYNEILSSFRKEGNSNIHCQFQVCVPESLMHSEAKQTEMLESEAAKGLFQGASKENRWLVLKRPELLDGFQRRVFKGNIWGHSSKVYDFLSTG